MIHRAVFGVFPALLLALVGVALAEEGESFRADWEPQRDKDGIAILTGPVAGSPFKAVRSVMTLEAPVAQLVAIIRDTAGCSDLSKLCKKAYEHEVVSETELFVYNLNDLPWPVADRDALTHVRWSMAPDSGVVTMVARVVGDILPANKRVVRLTYGETRWILTPKENGQIEVVSESHIDPEGRVPAWITNRLLLDEPFKTMQNLRSVVASGRHKDARFDFLGGVDG